MKKVLQKPYLMRATYDWIRDSEGTPYIQIDTKVLDDLKGVIPSRFMKDPQLILNISDNSVVGLSIKNEVTFSCRFDGNRFSCTIPLDSIMSIADKESGQGMSFPPPETTTKEMDEKSKETTKDIIKNIQDNVITVNFGGKK